MPSPRRKLAAIMATPILFLASLASLTLTTPPLILLFWLMQPTTRVNPGVSAYIPPPATRVEPIARTAKSRDPPRELSSATNFARDHTRPELIEDPQVHQIQSSPKHELRPTSRKQSRVGYRRKHEQSARTYAQQWDDHWPPSYR
jgi:hypothetical protein